MQTRRESERPLLLCAYENQSMEIARCVHFRTEAKELLVIG